MAFFQAQYDPRLVAISILIATLASFVALDLAQRVRTRDRQLALGWGLGGSVALGTGIWAMHFVGMMAFSLPITLGYTLGMTLLSWLAAVAVSGVALVVASRGRLRPARLGGGALLMGGGICAMHYTGMLALDLAPGIVWNGWLVAASALIAVAASAAALLIFSWLRSPALRSRRWPQVLAAVVMGLAIAGMHYTGMAAANFPAGSVCLSAGALGGNVLGFGVVMAAVALLSLTLFTSTLDARLRDRSVRLAQSLQVANAELTAANAELRTRAFHDALTGLPNRLHFDDRLRDAATEPLAVLFVDLDGFKPVNESLGHAQGDTLLQETARRLRTLAGDDTLVARVGGDEFVLMLQQPGDDAEQHAALARRIVAALGEPHEIGGAQFRISASVGIALHPDDGGADKLLAHADAAMNAAKQAGGGSWARFEPHMASRALEQLRLQSDLRDAIAAGQLQLHYQPKVDARSGACTGVEALLRWQHPERGAVSPAQFIPVAERFGLIGALGDWVIEEACRQMAAWAAAGTPRRVAINLSVHQLRQGDLAQRIDAALRRHGVAPADLLCEITESAAMDDLRHSQQAFAELLGIGVFLSIDDFGTGHSSLSYLRRLPARQLKIDRSFVKDLEHSADARAIVHAVLAVAHALGLKVVAEGVETAAQRQILVALGCDELQGYLLARPMPAQALAAWDCGRSGQRVAHEVQPVLAEEHRVADEAGRRAEHAA